MVAIFTYTGLVLSLLVTWLIIPKWISVARKYGITGRDVHKKNSPRVAEAGGVCVILGFIVGFFSYIAFMVFIYRVQPEDILFSFAAATAILLAAFIGLIDDVLGWKKGLRQSSKLILSFFIPLPIMVLKAGSSVMNIPFFGETDFGLFFPLVLVPVAIIGTSNGFNLLGGFNGLEALQGATILGFLGILSHFQGSTYLSALCACFVISVLVFLAFNRYPARVFPGDTLTYSIGASIGVIAVLGNIEKFALILFGPYFIELFLKIRGRAKKESFGSPSANGFVKNRYKKIYSLTHLSIFLQEKLFGKAREPVVVLNIWLFQMVFSTIALLSYFGILGL